MYFIYVNKKPIKNYLKKKVFWLYHKRDLYYLRLKDMHKSSMHINLLIDYINCLACNYILSEVWYFRSSLFLSTSILLLFSLILIWLRQLQSHLPSYHMYFSKRITEFSLYHTLPSRIHILYTPTYYLSDHVKFYTK